MAVTFGHTLMDQMPSEAAAAPSTFSMGLSPGPAGWGDGDEQVTVELESGASLSHNTTSLRVTVGTTEYTYASGSLGGPFADGEFTIGEDWTTNLTIPASTTVDVRVIRESPDANVVGRSLLESGTQDCSTDDQAPYVSTWSQDPDDLVAGTVGSFDVTITAKDACAGVDEAKTPHLEYRFGNETVFNDAGAMNALGADTWNGSIPEPTDGWEAHADRELVFRVNPLADEAGNQAPSANQTETIEDEIGTGELTYFTDHVIFSGTFTEVANATNASDDGAHAVIEEAVTSPNASTSEAYATAYSSHEGATTPGDATGSPDDRHAGLDARDEWIGVEGFRTAQGEILTVEIAMEGHYDGTTDGADDELVLSYKVGHDAGATEQAFDTSTLSASTDGPAEYVNVTGDRDWSWSDVDDLAVRTTYDRNGPADNLTYSVDAQWVRVTYDDPAYNTSVRLDVGGLPTGTHDLELRYAVSDETHHVEIWDFTSSSWVEQGASLSSSSMDDFSHALTSDQVDANETRFRIVDDARDPDQQSTVDLDYARVRTR